MTPRHSRSLAAVLLAMATGAAVAMGSAPKTEDDAAVVARIKPLARVDMVGVTAPTPGNRSGEVLYKSICIACHESGAANAPKIGDKAAWAPRIALGPDALLKSVLAGKNAMPPKGGSDATPEELARAIAYIANKAGANFKPPK